MRASTGSKLARFIDAHQQDRRGAVVQRRGIPGGDAAVSRAKRRAQLGQLLLAGLRARLLIVSHESRRLFACGTLTGTISSRKRPAAIAAAALRWELAAKASGARG